MKYTNLKHNIRRSVLPTLLLAAIALTPSVGKTSLQDRFNFPVSRTQQGETLQLAGTSLYRYLGLIKVFAAGLYRAPGVQQVYPPNGHPKMLEIRYFVDIDAEDFIEITVDGIRRVVGEQRYETLRPTVDQFNRLYRDVESGDRYGLFYTPGGGTTLLLNGTPLGTVGGRDFAEALFGIWLSERSLDVRFRERLLADL